MRPLSNSDGGAKAIRTQRIVQRLSSPFGITPDDREESAKTALYQLIMCGLKSNGLVQRLLERSPHRCGVHAP